MDYASALLKGRGGAPATAAAPAPKPIARPAPSPIAPPKAAAPAASPAKAAAPAVDPVESAGPFGRLPVPVAVKIASFAGPQATCNLGVTCRYVFEKVLPSAFKAVQDQLPKTKKPVIKIREKNLTDPGLPLSTVDREQHPSGIVPVIQNIVATVNLATQLDLKKIALEARNAEYNPRRFAACIMRIRDPKTTCLVFSSGKLVITGARSEDAAKTAARKFARIIQKIGFNVSFKEFTVQNIVASCDVRFKIRLEGLSLQHNQFSSYEPEMFPGLIYRMMSPKVVLLIFVSGKIVLTGAKTRLELYESFENIYPVLEEFRNQ